MKNITLTLVGLLVLLASFTIVPQNLPIIIKGVVVEENTRKPVQNAYVFIIDGEEEDLTNSKGEFRIESWQKLPVTINVTNANYQKYSAKVNDATKQQHIRLKSKLK